MQLTLKEMAFVDKRRARMKPLQLMALLNEFREGREEPPIGIKAVRNYVNGVSHARNRKETRGRKAKLAPKDVKKLFTTRRRLIRKANNQYPVVWDDVIEAAGFKGKVHVKTVQKTLAKTHRVRSRPARAKVPISEDDAKKRKKKADAWYKRPLAYWTSKVAYKDEKQFPMPLTKIQKKRFQATRITNHLRAPGEGCDQGFTRPRQKHSFVGLPSVCVSAAVAKDKIIMFHVHKKRWNGERAAENYKGPLLKALRRTWRERKSYTLVEDGDRKGNQSNKGIAAKKAAGIRAQVLPPRTPEWMPLDYAIWAQICDKLYDTAPQKTESKKEFITRLKGCAKKVTKGFVRKTIAKMKQKIADIRKNRGYHIKSD